MEVQSYKTSMSKRVAELKASGHRRMNWRMTVDFMGEPITIDVDDATDEWLLRMQARVKTIAVNNRQVKPLWYEEILVAKHSVDDCPQFLTIPDSVISPLMAARETVADLLDGIADISTAVKTVLKARDTLLDIDRSFELDLKYLETKAGLVLHRIVYDKTLMVLPKDDEVPRSFLEVHCKQ